MAEVIITIPDQHVQIVLDAFAYHYDYNGQKQENETRAEFAKRMIIMKMKSIIRRYKIETETRGPIQQAIAAVDLIELL